MPPRRSTRARRNVAGQRNEGVGNQPPPPAPPSPPPPPPQPQPRRYIETFINQKPPQFDGLGEPSAVETWIRALERIFEFMESTDQERLACVKFQLTGPADFWWDTKLKTMNPARREALTWEEFKEELNNKYVPMSYRRTKIEEFHTLRQGRMTVTEYDRAFCELTRYVPELVDTDEKIAEKFRAGLRHDIRAAVASRRGITYSEVLSCALDVEEALPKEKTVVQTTSLPPPYQQNGRDKRKWEGDHTPYDSTRQRPLRNPPHYGGRQNTPYQRNDFRPRAPQCVNCLKNHFGECREKIKKCYTCNGNGHFARECPSRRTGFGARPNNLEFRPQTRALQADSRGYLPAPQQQQQQQQQQQRRQGPPTQARAYALEGKRPMIEQGSKEQDDMDRVD